MGLEPKAASTSWTPPAQQVLVHGARTEPQPGAPPEWALDLQFSPVSKTWHVVGNWAGHWARNTHTTLHRTMYRTLPRPSVDFLCHVCYTRVTHVLHNVLHNVLHW